MLRIIARKVPALIASVLVVSFLTFLLVDKVLARKGDPCILILGPAYTPDTYAHCRARLKLDDPFFNRYGHWLDRAVLHADLGRSGVSNRPVFQDIKDRLPVTGEIGLLAIFMALLGAIPVGTLAAYRSGGAIDRSITAGTFALLAIPNFMVALFLIYLFAVRFGVLPATGWVNFTDNPVQNLRTALMPALSLAIGDLAVYSRLLRTDMISTLQEDFVAMARSKGLPTWRILLRHALRPSSLSLFTLVGLQMGAILGGAVIVEVLFALPGVGRLLYESITQRDFVMIQGVVLFLSTVFVVVNFLVDLSYSLLDPRIRLGRSAAAST